MGVDAGEETRPRRGADGVVAVGVAEGNAASGQSIDVRGACLGVAADGVIVQVVANDQDDVGPGLRARDVRRHDDAQEDGHGVERFVSHKTDSKRTCRKSGAGMEI